MNAPSVALITFGCAKNLVDSEIMLGLLGRSGFQPVPDPARADLVVLNTCGFIGPSRAEAEAAIAEALDRKARRGGRVVVAGCCVQRYGDEMKRLFPGVDAWLGVADVDKIAAAARGLPFRPGSRAFLGGPEAPRRLSTPAGWAYLKVSEGCSHGCAFCAIPAIKGPYRSRSAASVLREAENLAARGVREIILVSQDTTSFGRDKGGRSGLARLLRRLNRVEGLAWIRFLYGYPEEIDDELLEAMALPKVCRYLDIPFQHADAGVVKRMGRTFSAERALRKIERIRRRLPGVALRTSLIVGFPGEGRREFDRLQAFVREAAFDHLGVFPYSREAGTPAWPLGDPISDAVKRRRLERILEIQAGISAAAAARWVGRTAEVLVEGPWAGGPGLLIGRTRSQAPEVDGAVLIDRPPAWTPSDDPLVWVEITEADVYDLHGRIASPRNTLRSPIPSPRRKIS